MSTRFNSIARVFRSLEFRVAAVGASVSHAIVPWALALGTLVLCLSASDPALANRRVALVIGNSAYRNAGTLPNTINDAKAMATLFKNAGFDFVDLRQDLGELEFKRAVRGFMSEAGSADIAVVYYAGHGIESGGKNYLIPVDAKLPTDHDAKDETASLDDETVSLDRVISTLQPAHQLRLIILDACRENPFVRKVQRTVSLRGIVLGLATIDPASMGADTVIAYAAKASSFSYDGDGQNSPFTTALLKYVAEPGLDIRIALGKVRDEVLRMTGGKQEPIVFSSLGGTAVSLVPAPAPKKTEPQPQALDSNDAIARDYELAERVGTRQAWESFLAAHKTGFYADLARAQLAKQKQAALEAAKPPAGEAEALARAEREKSAKDLADKQKAEQLRVTKAQAEALALRKRQEEARLAQPRVDRKDLDPPPSPSAPPKIEPEANSHAEICKRDTQTLGRLRANPLRDEIDRFARDLKCEELRRQVNRLLESVSPSQPDLPQIAVLRDPSFGEQVDRPAREKAPAPTLHDPSVEFPGAPKTDADRTSDVTSCNRDKDKLVKLRANPVREDVARFAHELHCETLRAQVTRLLESLGD
ncbi:MAG: caspase family protein [Beijerinckiaceae bacterium]